MNKFEVLQDEHDFLTGVYSRLKTTKPADWCRGTFSMFFPESAKCCMLGHVHRDSLGHTMEQVHDLLRTVPSTYSTYRNMDGEMYRELNMRWLTAQIYPKKPKQTTTGFGIITSINDGCDEKYNQKGPKGRSMAHLRNLIASARIVEQITPLSYD
jgi:hypothetical protein